MASSGDMCNVDEVGMESSPLTDWQPGDWKHQSQASLLEIFHTTAARTSQVSDPQVLTQAVQEVIAKALEGLEGRVRQYAQYLAHPARQHAALDCSQSLLQVEQFLKFSFDERWRVVGTDQDMSGVSLSTDINESPREEESDLHQRALVHCRKDLLTDLRLENTTFIDKLVADDVISDVSGSSILRKPTRRERNEAVLRLAGSMSLEQFHAHLLPALRSEQGNSFLADKLLATMEELRDRPTSHVQRRCHQCRLREKVDLRRLADSLLQRALIPQDFQEDLRHRTLPSEEAWQRLFRHVGHTQRLLPVLSEKYQAVVEEMEKCGITSLECRCHTGLLEIVEALSEGVASDIARMSDFTSLLQKDKLPLPEYKMSSSKRGCCLLVVNINYTHKRVNSLFTHVMENSARVLRDTFRRLGFDVTELRNLSAKQLMDEADRIARMDHSASDCLAVILLTDAGRRDSLHCSDGVDVSLDDVRERFAVSRCPSLAGKPKLFYRPWGRGFSRQGGVTTTDEGGKTQQVSNHSDFVVLESCPPECMTTYDGNTNVLRHVQLLAAVLERHGHDHDFLSCVTMANTEYSNYRMQRGSYITANVYSSLTKSLKFPKPQ